MKHILELFWVGYKLHEGTCVYIRFGIFYEAAGCVRECSQCPPSKPWGNVHEFESKFVNFTVHDPC